MKTITISITEVQQNTLLLMLEIQMRKMQEIPASGDFKNDAVRYFHDLHKSISNGKVAV